MPIKANILPVRPAAAQPGARMLALGLLLVLVLIIAPTTGAALAPAS